MNVGKELVAASATPLVLANRPDNTEPWTLCISGGQTQYLFAADEEPGRVYKRRYRTIL